MSDYVYVGKDFNTLRVSYENGTQLALDHLAAVSKAQENLGNSKYFQGNTADNIHDYLEQVYPLLTGYLLEAIRALYNGYGAYFDKYVTLFDSSRENYDEHVSSGELDQINQDIKTSIKIELEKIDPDFSSKIGTLYSNGDINFSYSNGYYAKVLSGVDGLSTQLTDWVEGMNGIEGNSSDECAIIRENLGKIRTILDYAKAGKPSSYDSGDFGALLASMDIATSFQNMVEEANGREEAAAHARQVGMEMIEQEEIDEREKEAATIGLITDIVCTVAVVAATAVAGPVGAVVVGGIAGAARSAIHEGLDQYVATGAGWGELDWGRIGIKALVGGVTGAATSAIGVGAGQLTNLAGGIASPILKTGANMLIGVGKKELNTLVDHGGNALSTAFIGRYEGKSWEDAWSEAGDVFVSDLGKDAVKGVFTGITSNATGFTGGMKDGFGKSLANMGISFTTGAADYTFETIVDEKEFKLRDMLGASTKSALSSGFSDAVSNIKDKTGYNAWLQKDGHDNLKLAAAFTSGGTEEYLKKNGGAYVEALIKGDENAADNLKLFDKDGKPTSALNNFFSGGTQSAAKNYYDKNLAPGTEKKEDIYQLDANGKPVLGEDGKPIVLGTRTTTNYGSKALFGQKKIVAETYTNVETDQNGFTTTTKTTTYTENGQQIGHKIDSTLEHTNPNTGEKMKYNTTSEHYERSDHKVFDSKSTSETTFDSKTGAEVSTTTKETSSETTNKWYNHTKTETNKTTVTTNNSDGSVETKTDTDKYTSQTKDTLFNKAGDGKSISESHVEKTTYKVGEGDKAVQHTVTSEKSTTISKNDLGKGLRTETKVSNKSEIEGQRTATHTNTTNQVEGMRNSVSTKTQDVNKNTYETKKVDDKLATGRIKTNVGVGGTYKYSDEAKERVNQKAAEERAQRQATGDEFLQSLRQNQTADDLHLRGW